MCIHVYICTFIYIYIHIYIFIYVYIYIYTSFLHNFCMGNFGRTGGGTVWAKPGAAGRTLHIIDKTKNAIAIKESVESSHPLRERVHKTISLWRKTTPHRWCPARKEPTDVCYIPPCVGLSLGGLREQPSRGTYWRMRLQSLQGQVHNTNAID